MKAALLRLMSKGGTLLTHRQRRLVLDRLRVGRLVERLAKDSFTEVALPSGGAMTISPLYHAHLARDGQLDYEAPVLAAIAAHLRAGDVFYDIGANVGVFALEALERVGPAGEVHAFEPEPNNLVCLRRSAARRRAGNLHLHEVAAGAADARMSFDRRGGAFSGRLVADAAQAAGAVTPVAVRAIDSLIRDGARPPTLVKIDVEGGEGAVLEGMAQTLATHRPAVLCEMHGFNPDGVRRACAALKAAGYDMRDLAGNAVDTDGPAAAPSGHVLARSSGD